jgi:hypothetical protein
MVVVRFGRPVIEVTRDRGMKSAAYGFASKPSTAPTYPIQVASVTGKGRYKLLIAGDGDRTAIFRVYVDGSAAPVDHVESDTSAVVEGVFNSNVLIRIEGSGLHSTYTFEVWTEQDYVTSVTVR